MLFNIIKRRNVINEVPFLGMILIGCLPSFLKCAYYRLRGAVIGKNVTLGMFSYIQSPEIVLADGVKIAPFSFIRTRTACRIGARSAIHVFTAIDTGLFEMGEDSTIGEQVTIGGMLTPRSSLIIGDRVKIYYRSFLNPTEPIIIEDEAGIGGGCCLFTHGSWPSMLDGFPASFGPITIGRRVWIAWNIFIMPNVTIGEDSIIGAGSIVTRNIPARTLAAGNPAKPLKTGAEYIRTVNNEEKHALLCGWFKEFADLLQYLGKEIIVDTTQNEILLRVTQPHTPDGVIAYQQQSDGTAHMKKDIIVSLTAINATIREERNRMNLTWFDVETHECALHSHPLSNEVRNFLMRYGVRFAVVPPQI